MNQDDLLKAYMDKVAQDQTAINNSLVQIHNRMDHLEDGQRDLNKSIVHLTERMDDKFAEVDHKFAEQESRAVERSKSDRRWILGTFIAVIGAAATIVGLFLQTMIH